MVCSSDMPLCIMADPEVDTVDEGGETGTDTGVGGNHKIIGVYRLCVGSICYVLH